MGIPFSSSTSVPTGLGQITRAFVDEEFAGFTRPPEHPEVTFVGMTRYDETIKAPFAYPPQDLRNTLGEVVANNQMKQLRIAETEKYAHVTFFSAVVRRRNFQVRYGN